MHDRLVVVRYTQMIDRPPAVSIKLVWESLKLKKDHNDNKIVF